MNEQDRLNDELLVLRCQEGDAAAFAELVHRWQRRLWRHAWRSTGEENAAWDVLQEAWIGISRGIGRLVDPAAFPAWAYQIVSNKCRDQVRREQRRRAAVASYGAQQCAAQGSADRQQGETLREALAQLSGADRAILALRYEEQFDTREIAQIFSVPEGTVKSRLFYARQRLRKFLENDHE